MGNVIKMEDYYQYGRISSVGIWSIWRNINNMGEYYQYGKISSIWGNISKNIYQQHQQPRSVKMRESLRHSARHMIIVVSRRVFHFSSRFPPIPIFLLISPLTLSFFSFPLQSCFSSRFPSSPVFPHHHSSLCSFMCISVSQHLFIHRGQVSATQCLSQLDAI